MFIVSNCEAYMDMGYRRIKHYYYYRFRHISFQRKGLDVAYLHIPVSPCCTPGAAHPSHSPRPDQTARWERWSCCRTVPSRGSQSRCFPPQWCQCRFAGTSPRMNEWMSEWMMKWTSEWINEWMDELINEWVNESINEWVNEWISKRMCEWINEWVNA